MSVAGLEIRDATGEDLDPTLRLVYDPPGPEAAGIAGSDERAVAIGACLQRVGFYTRHGGDVLAACCNGEVVGVMVGSCGAGDRATLAAASTAFARELLRAIPVWALPGLLWRSWLRSRLDFETAPDAYNVSEIHVAPPVRSRGVGTALMQHAETRARERSCRVMSLSTLMSNPARRLYERLGFVVTRSRTVRGYEALTGAPGRVFMEKAL